MYLRITERRNRDGSSVAYYALAENVWNAQTKRSEAQVIHNFGRADQLDKAALQRLVASIQRVISADAAGAIATSDKCTARGFWDTRLNPTPPWRRVEAAFVGRLSAL
jgi:hypothetical protein